MIVVVQHRIDGTQEDVRGVECFRENAELKERLSEQKLYTEFKCNDAVKKREVYEKEHRLFIKAKELIERLIDTLECVDGSQVRELKVVKEAEQFIKGNT